MTGTSQQHQQHAHPKQNRKKSFKLLRAIAFVGGIAAVVKELRLPREKRTWHGSVGGFMPYDFRRPTMERARQRMWAPDSRYIFTARVFGAGWTVNFGRLYELARRRLSR